MKKRNVIDITLLSEHYRIDPDGRVWNFRNGKYVRPSLRGSGYEAVRLKMDKWKNYYVHRLVAAMYLGPCPDGMEVNHKDRDKKNNHYSNLEYVTHSDNLKKMYSEGGLISYWLGVKRGPIPDDVKKKMAASKWKRMWASDGREWKSMGDCAAELGIDRTYLYKIILEGGFFKRDGVYLYK